jgi:hypothetical protein
LNFLWGLGQKKIGGFYALPRSRSRLGVVPHTVKNKLRRASTENCWRTEHFQLSLLGLDFSLRFILLILHFVRALPPRVRRCPHLGSPKLTSIGFFYRSRHSWRDTHPHTTAKEAVASVQKYQSVLGSPTPSLSLALSSDLSPS